MPDSYAMPLRSTMASSVRRAGPSSCFFKPLRQSLPRVPALFIWRHMIQRSFAVSKVQPLNFLNPCEAKVITPTSYYGI